MSMHPGVQLLELTYGSHAHGTNTPTSDVDTRGVFLLPNDEFLGLGRPKTTWEDKPEDAVFWELGHFIGLLCKGNPNLVGMLYTPLNCVGYQHEIIDELAGLRSMFLSQSFRSAYMGWIHREAHDLGNMHKGHAKRLSHLPRLIWELESVYRTGVMVVRPDREKRQAIIDIKTGVRDYDEATAWIGELILDLEALDAEVGPSLPESPREEANAWLLDIRHRFGQS